VISKIVISIIDERPVPPQAHSLSAPFDAIAGEGEHPDCHLQQVLDQGHPTKNKMLTGPGQSLLEIDHRPNPPKPANNTQAQYERAGMDYEQYQRP